MQLDKVVLTTIQLTGIFKITALLRNNSHIIQFTHLNWTIQWSLAFAQTCSGTPLQHSCLENPMDGGAWKAAVHGVAKSRTRLSDFTFTFHSQALEKQIATHSSVLAWRIPGMGEPSGLPSMGSGDQLQVFYPPDLGIEETQFPRDGGSPL